MQKRLHEEMLQGKQKEAKNLKKEVRPTPKKTKLGRCDAPNPGVLIDNPSTREIFVDVRLPDTTHENRAESPLYEELYPEYNMSQSHGNLSQIFKTTTPGPHMNKNE